MALQLESIHPLTQVARYRDPEMGGHLVRIGKYCAEIARRMDLPEELQELLNCAAPMHDLGKLAIPDSILSKTGPLTPQEFAVVKQHTVIGHQLLCDANALTLRTAATIALSHHERFDGTGYPFGLKGERIPLIGRICAVADVFDALISNRPYKDAWPVDFAIAEIRRGSGTQFDPKVVDAFLSSTAYIAELVTQFSDPPRRLRIAQPLVAVSG